MGCYGIGISRTLAAVVEQHNDDDGIIWPVNLAPFAVHLIPINIKNKEQHELAERLYAIFQAEGIDVLFDDRHERPGVKFADSDLIGVPLRIIIGKKANEEIVELKVRKTGESLEVPITNVIEMIDQKLKELQR